MKSNFCFHKKWIKVDQWRGYEQPIYAVAGANDTGTFSDSPCPTQVCVKELLAIAAELQKAGIPYRTCICVTSNVFCIHHYLVVPVGDEEKGRKVVKKYLDENETVLSYLVE